MAGYLTVFLLFLLQFIYFPIGISHFETPKVYVAEIVIFFLLLNYIFSTNTFSWKSIKNTHLIPFAILLVLTLFHILFFATGTTFSGNAFRLQGVFLLWMLLCFAFVSAFVNPDKKINPYFIFGCLIVQLIFTLLIDGGVSQRAVGLMGEPNALVAATIFTWPFLFFTKKPAAQYLKILCLGIVAVILVLADSRSGIIAFLLQLLFLTLLYKLKFSFKTAVIAGLVILLITYILPFIEQKGIYEKRSEVWYVAVVAGLHSPIVGNGFGNTEYALHNASKSVKTNLSGSYIDSSHNIFLDWWVQGGIVGLLVLISILFQSIRTMVAKKQTLQITLFLGLLAVLSFNPASIVTLVALWWLVGRNLFTTGK